MAQEELWLAIRADIADIKSKLNTITSEGNKSANVLSSNFQKLGKIITGVFAVGTITKFATSSLKAFMETERSALSLGNTLRNVAGVSEEGIRAIENAVNNLEIATAFDDVEIRNAIKSMLLRFGDVELAIKSLPVAMEMARSTGESLTSMMDILGQGFQGQARGLRQFGITTVEGKTNLEILNTVMAKVRGSTETFAKTTAGAVEDMSISWGNLKELIGGYLSPLMAGFTKELAKSLAVMIGGAEANKEYSESLKEVGGTIAKIGLTIVGVIPWLFKFGSVLGAILDPRASISDINKQIDALTDFEKSIINMWKEEGKYAPTSRKNIDEIIEGLSKYKGALEGIGEANKRIGDEFKAVWEPITLVGGNLPELSKFIGNLRYTSPVITRRTELNLNVRITDESKKPSEVSKAVAKGIEANFQQGWWKQISESHATGVYRGRWY